MVESESTGDQTHRKDRPRATWEKMEMPNICRDEGNRSPGSTDDLMDWIAEIPLSKAIKNISRDFSDAVLMSDIIKFYYPHLVVSHFYIPGNSIKTKRDNWDTLNRRVLEKINMHITPETIDQLVQSRAGAIEKLLQEFREKQMSIDNTIKESENSESAEIELSEKNMSNSSPERKLSNRTITSPSEEVETNQEDQEANEDEEEEEENKIVESRPNFIVRIFQILFSILFFWTFIFRSRSTLKHVKKESKSKSNAKFVAGGEEAKSVKDEISQLKENYTKTLQELRTKADVIKTLCHKVAFLEGSLKLKDQKITSLTARIQEIKVGIPSRPAVVDAGLSPRLTMHTTCSLAKQRKA